MILRFFQKSCLMAILAISLSTAAPLKIGAWVGGPETNPQPSKANVDAFQKLQNRNLDYISVFVIWGINDWAWTQTYADIAANNKSILLVTWMANGYKTSEIVSGKADNYLKAYATGAKAYGKEIWLRPFHEANGDWYDWGIPKAGQGNTNQTLIDAWKHVVKIFRDQSVTNVKWVWTTNATNSTPGGTYTDWFPGDDWVDMVSIDGYNWGTAQSWSKWQSFSEVFTPAYNALSVSKKPLFIPEFSSSEHGGNKAQWITQMFTDIPTKFPKIFALMWFSQTKSAEADWAVNTSTAALDAWKKGIGTGTSIKVQSNSSVQSPRQSTMQRIISTHSTNCNQPFYDLQGRFIDANYSFKLPAGAFVKPRVSR